MWMMWTMDHGPWTTKHNHGLVTEVILNAEAEEVEIK